MSHARTTATDLAKLLGESSVPIYALDEERQIVFCNTACARWVGLRASQLIGQHSAFHTPGDGPLPAAAASGLCPPPKAFSGQAQTAVVFRTAADGTIAHRRGYFLPLADGEDECAAVLAILEANDCPADGGSASTSADARLHEQVRHFRQHMAGRHGLDSLIGQSPAIVRARAQIELASQTGANVLVLGPAGSGKDHAARALHYGQRESNPLVPLDCAVSEANLLRSTLRGIWNRSSVTSQASLMLLLLDADCMPAEVQADLAEMLRGNSTHVRVVATAARPLGELVDGKSYSRELAFALSTITIELPPLAARREDIPLLAQAFLEEANALGLKQVGGFSPDALDRLAEYGWPGNVDELAAMVREAHEQAQAGEVTARDLPERLQFAADAVRHAGRAEETIVLEEFLAQVERELIERAMRRAKGNKSKTAKLLGLTRPRLYRRLVQLGLELPDFREE